uniref:Protein cereblon n=2 Tax=Heliothis virescens TaxID=7102 RepID=A0A2A4K2N0_HELVI
MATIIILLIYAESDGSDSGPEERPNPHGDDDGQAEDAADPSEGDSDASTEHVQPPRRQVYYDSEGESIEVEEEPYDISIAASHSYLGAGLVQARGRRVPEAGWRGRVPVAAHHGVVFPGEVVPMLLPDPGDAALIVHAINTDKLFGLLCPSENGDKLSGYGVLCEVMMFGIEHMLAQPTSVTFKARAINRFVLVRGPRQPHAYSSAPVQRRLRTLDAAGTPWPLFVHDILDFERMRRLICDYFDTISLGDRLPEEPVSLSFWVASNLPLSLADRLALFAVDNALLRLHMECHFINRKSVLCCSSCMTQIARREHIFAMSSEGVHSNYTNLGGYMHDLLTVRTATNVRAAGAASEEYSWFPGYAWTVAHCRHCAAHVGWRRALPPLRRARRLAVSTRGSPATPGQSRTAATAPRTSAGGKYTRLPGYAWTVAHCRHCAAHVGWRRALPPLRRARRLAVSTRGSPATPGQSRTAATAPRTSAGGKYTRLPGYAWTVAHCRHCAAHVGWRRALPPLRRARRLAVSTRGSPATPGQSRTAATAPRTSAGGKYTRLPGYAWTVAHCRHCAAHVGWRRALPPLRRARRLAVSTRGSPATPGQSRTAATAPRTSAGGKYTRLPGYAWTVAHCRHCAAHVGWRRALPPLRRARRLAVSTRGSPATPGQSRTAATAPRTSAGGKYTRLPGYAWTVAHCRHCAAHVGWRRALPPLRRARRLAVSTRGSPATPGQSRTAATAPRTSAGGKYTRLPGYAWTVAHCRHCAAHVGWRRALPPLRRARRLAVSTRGSPATPGQSRTAATAPRTSAGGKYTRLPGYAWTVAHCRHCAAHVGWRRALPPLRRARRLAVSTRGSPATPGQSRTAATAPRTSAGGKYTRLPGYAWTVAHCRHCAAHVGWRRALPPLRRARRLAVSTRGSPATPGQSRTAATAPRTSAGGKYTRLPGYAWTVAHCRHCAAHVGWRRALPPLRRARRLAVSTRGSPATPGQSRTAATAPRTSAGGKYTRLPGYAWTVAHCRHCAAHVGWRRALPPLRRARRLAVSTRGSPATPGQSRTAATAPRTSAGGKYTRLPGYAWTVAHCRHCAAHVGWRRALPPLRRARRLAVSTRGSPATPGQSRTAATAPRTSAGGKYTRLPGYAWTVAHCRHCAAHVGWRRALPPLRRARRLAVSTRGSPATPGQSRTAATAPRTSAGGKYTRLPGYAWTVAHCRHCAAHVGWRRALPPLRRARRLAVSTRGSPATPGQSRTAATAPRTSAGGKYTRLPGYAWTVAHCRHCAAHVGWRRALPPLRRARRLAVSTRGSPATPGQSRTAATAPRTSAGGKYTRLPGYAWTVAHCRHCAAHVGWRRALPPLRRARRLAVSTRGSPATPGQSRTAATAPRTSAGGKYTRLPGYAWTVAHCRHCAAHVGWRRALPPLRRARRLAVSTRGSPATPGQSRTAATAPRTSAGGKYTRLPGYAWTVAHCRHCAAHVGWRRALPPLRRARRLAVSTRGSPATPGQSRTAATAPRTSAGGKYTRLPGYAWTVAHCRHCAAHVGWRRALPPLRRARRLAVSTRGSPATPGQSRTAATAPRTSAGGKYTRLPGYAWTVAHCRHCAAHVGWRRALPPLRRARRLAVSTRGSPATPGQSRTAATAPRTSAGGKYTRLPGYAWTVAHCRHCAAHVGWRRALPPLRRARRLAVSTRGSPATPGQSRTAATAPRTSAGGKYTRLPGYAWTVAHCRHCAAHVGWRRALPPLRRARRLAK